MTDSNAAFFERSPRFRRLHSHPHGLLSPGCEEADFAYPHLHDDEFVREHLDKWLS